MKSPTPEQIKQSRQSACLTIRESAVLVHCTMRAWQMWEAGERIMNLANWELFQIKTEGTRMSTTNYYAEALEAITGAKIPAELRAQIPQITNAAEFNEFAYKGNFANDLQDWVNLNLNPLIQWTTGEAVMDAALMLVERAFENSNLRRDPKTGEVVHKYG